MARNLGQPRVMMCGVSLALASLLCGGNVAEAALSPDLNASFVGLEDASRFGPADAQVAVGPAHVVQAINSQYRITDKTGVVIQTTDPRVTFDAFYAANPTYTEDPPRSAPLNPTAFYDHFSGRFVIVWKAENDNGSQSVLLIQVSNTANPTQGWRFFNQRVDLDVTLAGTLDTDALSNSLAVGFDNTNLYFSMNQLSPSGAFRYAKVRVAAKHQFYNPGPNPAQFYDLINIREAAGLLASAVRPCVTFGAPNKEYMVSAPVSAGNNLTLYSIAGTWPNATVTPPLLKVEGTVAFNAWTAPTRMAQPSTTATLDGGDGRLLNAVFRNGVVYTGHSIRSGNLTCAAGVKSINVATKTKVLDEVLGAVGECYSFPAVMADATNNVYVVFNRSSKTAFAECRYALKKSSEATFEVSKVLKVGVIKSLQFNGAWGDYNGIALDPTLNGGVWVSGMFAQNTSTLNFASGTWIGNFGRPGTTPVGPQIIAEYNDLAKTLTVTGDAFDSNVDVTYSAGVVTVVAGAATQVNGLPSVTFSVSTNPIIVNANLGAGRDVISFTGMNCSTMDLKLGTQDDRITLRLTTAALLLLDGGTGTDLLTTITSRFTRKTIIGFP